MMFDLGCLIVDVKGGDRISRNSTRKRGINPGRCIPRLRVGLRKTENPCSFPSTIKHPPSNIPRSGISLIEILVSIFVLLFGLMGVAAIFPVGNHYVIEGEKFDLGSSLTQNAFEELSARGMLQPELWLYASTIAGGPLNSDFIVPQTNLTPPPNKTKGYFNMPLTTPPLIGDDTYPFGPGHAFVLDPLGTANISELRFPFAASTLPGPNNPWFGATVPLSGNVWPIRRLTLPQANGVPLNTAVGETIFRLRDDLAVTQPEEDDRPSIQNWDLDNSVVPPRLLRRQYKGDYSWLATIVPTSSEALDVLQPSSGGYGEARYDVSVVVFRRREVAPSATSERLIQAEFINDGEIAIFDTITNDKLLVDAAMEDIRPGNWIALAGVNQTTGVFMMKWYRILARDEETDETGNFMPFGTTATPPVRYLTLDGPDWPEGSFTDLRAILMPGVISVATQQLSMEDFSLWKN